MSGISSEYAQALFMLAMEKNLGNEYDKALDLVSDAFAENPMSFYILKICLCLKILSLCLQL